MPTVKPTSEKPRLIPLVSDTETQPTAEMRIAIANADVGDEQRGEDPTVNRLQARVAELLGKEAALWFPGGTMCNFVAVKVHTRPADGVIADWMSHVIRAESAGVALSSGVLVEPIVTQRGVFTVDQAQEALNRLSTVAPPYGPPPKLLCVEQTHNFAGGAIWSLQELAAVSEFSKRNGLATHMDGARLLNACVASGVSAASYASHVDSVWIDFTKGLGAPIGAVMAGSREFIAEARRYKHVFAGAMRQAGIAAAGCLHALDHHVDRLAEDHSNARRLANGLSEVEGIKVLTAVPETNMVYFDPAGLGLSHDAFLSELEHRGVRMGKVRGAIRAVTHLDVSSADIEHATQAIRDIAANPGQRQTGQGARQGY
ncbi:threonine aldolase family protein [Comamonas sp. w2-DMI]|uniref:threonine aldolase family protein n=1 Tax=Comamonas sp. w2-DMI TaxID=3126391 RepID=UPI0032E506B7